MNDFNYDNEIIEVSDETSTSTLEDLIKKEAESSHQEPSRKKKNKIFKDRISDLSTKQKAIICLLVFLTICTIVCLVLFFVLKDDEEPEKEEEPVVIIEKDNYRYENGKLIFLDVNDKEIGSYECVNQDSDKCYVTKLTYENDTFDRVKSVYENNEELLKNSKVYKDKYIFVTDGSVVHLYNMDTKETELELNSIKAYSTDEDLVVVEDDKKLYGLIEITDEGFEYLIRCSYDNLGIVNAKDILLVAKDKDKQYIIDKNGKKLSKNISVAIKSANENYIVGSTNDTYNLYDYEFEELLSDYDHISLHDSVIALVKSKRLYLVNDTLNKLYEDGIRLENNNYVKEYIYNEDNRLIETKKSYEIDSKDNVITINIGENTKEINTLEGDISSNLDYISYFDGKIYFYGDEEKNDVIGTYTCNNQNSLVNIEDGLDNCGVYADDLGISGIYNNEYVFIYDYNENEGEVYLYNIKEKKVKGTYSEIKIVNDKELGEKIKPIYTSSSFIIAKSATGSNKGNFGVLEINSEKVQGKIGFKYENIELIDKYYVLVSIDKTSSIYDKEFNKISNEFSYVKLFDKHYVGINNNKLNVFTYDSQKEILEEGINVTNNDFQIDFTNGFIITVNNIKYSYDKDGKKVVESNNNNENIDEETNSNENVENEGESDGEQE